MKQILGFYIYLCVLSAFSLNSANAQINWQSGGAGISWAFACDFPNNDLSSARVAGDQCSNTCINTAGCTHFSWSDYQGGTCWMKSNAVTLNDAKFNNNQQMICGVVPARSGQGRTFSNKSALNVKNDQ